MQNQKMNRTEDKTWKAELKDQIEQKRKELSRHIDASDDGELLYQLSVELDHLISQYMAG